MYGYVQKKIASFGHALSGLLIAWREESNFRFEVVWAVIVLLLAFSFRISQSEFLMVVFMFGFVLTAEIINTALEELCDKFQPTHDPRIAKIKDLSAAAVHLAALTSVIVGLVIFIPHFSKLI